jgi:cytochrome c556
MKRNLIESPQWLPRAALIACIGFGSVALAATPEITRIISNRQANLKEVGSEFKKINDQLKTEKPDLRAIGLAAQTIQRHADELPTWFPKGSGTEAGVKTRAKAEIWTQADAFTDAGRQFQSEAAKLATTAAGSDLNALRAQAKATGEACGTCHKSFREKES